MIVTTLTAAAALSLTACSSDGGGTAEPAKSSATVAAPASSAPATAGSSAPAGTSAPSTAPTKPAGTPNTEQLAKELAMVAGLKQIDPKLAQDNQKTVAAAQKTCADIKAGKDDATVAKNTVGYFGAAGASLNEQQGQMVAVIVKAALCP